MNKYTVAELSNILGVTETAVRKKLKRGVYQTVEETIDGRLVTIIMLNDDELKEHIESSKRIKQKLQLLPEPTENVQATISTSNNNKNDSDKLLEFMERYAKRFDNFSERLENVYKEKEDVSKKLYLLEDKSKDLDFYKENYFKIQYERDNLQQKVDELTKRNNELEEQLKMKSSFFGMFKK